MTGLDQTVQKNQAGLEQLANGVTKYWARLKYLIGKQTRKFIVVCLFVFELNIKQNSSAFILVLMIVFIHQYGNFLDHAFRSNNNNKHK